MGKKSNPAARKRCRNGREQIDVAALLNKKVTVGKDGRKQSMSPFEISLRALVKKALKEHNLSAINSLAKSGSKRPAITVEGGHSNGDCGQQVMAA